MKYDSEVKEDVTKEVVQQIDEIVEKLGMDEWTIIMFKADGSKYEAISNFTDLLSVNVFRDILFEILKQSQSIYLNKKASA